LPVLSRAEYVKVGTRTPPSLAMHYYQDGWQEA
jgi:hypothetical protein